MATTSSGYKGTIHLRSTVAVAKARGEGVLLTCGVPADEPRRKGYPIFVGVDLEEARRLHASLGALLAQMTAEPVVQH